MALFDDPTIRPTISTSPSPRASNVDARSSTERLGLVDVVAVAPRADVALRIERRAAQRTGRPAGRDDPGRPRDEGPGGVGRHHDAQQVGAILVLVVVLVGIDLFTVLGLGARLEEHPLRVPVPAKRERAGPT